MTMTKFQPTVTKQLMSKVDQSAQVSKSRPKCRGNVTWLNVSYTVANTLHNSTTLVTKNDWKKTFWITTTQSVCIRVAHTGIKNLQSQLAIIIIIIIAGWSVAISTSCQLRWRASSESYISIGNMGSVRNL